MPVNGNSNESGGFTVLREQENRLFDDWKRAIADDSGTIFVTDGVVNEAAWHTAPRKVLYLLKEVNGADREWDERDYLGKYNTDPDYIKTHSPTVNVLSQWQYGITYDPQAAWREVEQAALRAEIQTKLLSEICLVNIKKTAGGAVVDQNQFDAYFNAPVNREKLRAQLALYQPDIVICGGTAWHLSRIKNWDDKDWQQTHRGIRYHQEAGTLYIDFCHPNNRGPKNMIYFSLLDALNELQAEKVADS